VITNLLTNLAHVCFSPSYFSVDFAGTILRAMWRFYVVSVLLWAAHASGVSQSEVANKVSDDAPRQYTVRILSRLLICLCQRLSPGWLSESGAVRRSPDIKRFEMYQSYSTSRPECVAVDCPILYLTLASSVPAMAALCTVVIAGSTSISATMQECICV